ncbi:FKBP-type peptidyl-prolyl cis-trans isomerase [Marinobacter zhanjiangensis]|uniref:Peptidyl-prolyl cis-trans isomerase n=1 Tax=Marinobacter zhanjiangensis TaxID=578215 RepID=A0ABQ3B1I1_9GAMM|nr:FKBP-type peptidyl-prolyl cis-trans isomerase [Marinobacter zhanjiangensis]GGY73591.1 peptidyl-prolyl cis-trans isomerase [Marinobacter zhanjiangensis]
MKKSLIALSVAGILAGCTAGTQTPEVTQAPLETNSQKVSYGMGIVFAERIKNDLPNLELEQFIEGFRLAHGGSEEARLSDSEIQDAMMAYQQEMQQKQQQEMQQTATENQEKGEAFLAENAEREEVMTTDSGLQYEVLEEGDGEKPAAEDEVKVHYTGELLSGEVFDSSRERGEPVTFRLNQVIAGWTEGLQLMNEGSRYKLYIPSDLAYGPGGNRGIGPNETLVFDVELLEVNPEAGQE